MKTTILALNLLLACALATAQETETPHWNSLNIPLESLKAWGTRHYTYSVRQADGKGLENLGTVSLTTELTGDSLILRDVMELRIKGKILRLELTQDCRKDRYLSPVRIKSKGEGDDEPANFEAAITEGIAVMRFPNGNERRTPVPDGTITDFAMFRLVTLVPLTPGKIYAYGHSLEASEMNLKENYRLTVVGPETITVGGRKVECTKFQLSGGGIKPANYWVDGAGVLQKLIMDDRKIIELKTDQ